MANPAKIAQTPSSKLGKIFLRTICQDKNYWEKTIFDLGPRPAFGITQAFTTGKDVPYQAISGVSKATKAICEKDSNSRQGLICHINFPIVITEGKLFESFFEEKLSVNEIENGTLIWRNNLISSPHSIIKIHTFAGFVKMLPSYKLDIHKMLTDSSLFSKEILERYSKSNPSYKLWK